MLPDYALPGNTLNISTKNTYITNDNTFVPLIVCVCTDGQVSEPDMSAGFCPDHKAAMVLFLDRVYGIEDQNFLLHLMEVGFLPDLRAAASLDTVRQR